MTPGEPSDNPTETPNKRPTLAVSMGDPAGIGPEIIVKALADPALRQQARFRVYGASAPMLAAATRAGIHPYWWRVNADSPLAGDVDRHDVVLLEDQQDDEEEGLLVVGPPGPSAAGGRASFRWLELAILAAQKPISDPGHADAIVTAPISKTSWNLAGHTRYPGHTEVLAARFRAKRTAMMFIGPRLRVVLATVHIPLLTLRDALTIGVVLDAILAAHDACGAIGVPNPRIGVCGLNPHAGEGGILGDEDDRIIAPAIQHAVREHGVDATGPHPADTLFLAAAAKPYGLGRFDCVVAMYHDQGLIPVKLLDRDEAVNVTVGLPTVRTSPAHGTAFDIAGTDSASPASMQAAIRLAIAMCRDVKPGKECNEPRKPR